MSTVQGASFPLPFGGKPRAIMVDLDPRALFAQGLSPGDVVTAINDQSLIGPAGEVRIGAHDFTVKLNNLPIRQSNGTTVYVRDVAHMRDGFAVHAPMPVRTRRSVHLG